MNERKNTNFYKLFVGKRELDQYREKTANEHPALKLTFNSCISILRSNSRETK